MAGSMNGMEEMFDQRRMALLALLLTGLDGGGPLHANGPVVAPGHVGGLISAVGGRRQRLALERHRGAVARVDALDRIDAAVCDGLPSPKLPVALKAGLVVGTGS